MLSSNIQSSTETTLPTIAVKPRPRVSVVMPAYNCARFLPKAIASVQAQTTNDWELLVINDGSTDGTALIATDRAAMDQRIHLFHQLKQGVSATRNWGIARARGELIAFLDADDEWHPDKLATHLQQFNIQPNLGVSFDQIAWMNVNRQVTPPPQMQPQGEISATTLLYRTPHMRPSSWVVRRQVFTEVGGFLLGLNYGEDSEWLLRVACGDRWHIQEIPAVLTHCCHRRQTITLTEPDQIAAAWQQFIEQVRHYAPQLVQQHYSLAQAVHLQNLAERSLQLQLPAAIAGDLLRRALQSDWQLLTRYPGKTISTFAAIVQRSLLRQQS